MLNSDTENNLNIHNLPSTPHSLWILSCGNNSTQWWWVENNSMDNRDHHSKDKGNSDKQWECQCQWEWECQWCNNNTSADNNNNLNNQDNNNFKVKTNSCLNNNKETTTINLIKREINPLLPKIIHKNKLKDTNQETVLKTLDKQTNQDQTKLKHKLDKLLFNLHHKTWKKTYLNSLNKIKKNKELS